MDMKLTKAHMYCGTDREGNLSFDHDSVGYGRTLVYVVSLEFEMAYIITETGLYEEVPATALEFDVDDVKLLHSHMRGVPDVDIDTLGYNVSRIVHVIRDVFGPNKGRHFSLRD